MENPLQPYEVFKIAERIESDSAKFYTKAAELSKDPVIKAAFEALASWELKHRDTFAKMLEEASLHIRQNINDRSGEFAGLSTFALNPNPARQIHPGLSEHAVVSMAISSEQEVIAFFNGLKDFTQSTQAKNAVDKIISEELEHIDMLKKIISS